MSKRTISKRHDMPSLEQRIITSLGGDSVGSQHLTEIIEETELAIAGIEQHIATTRETAADLIAMPDSDAAQAAVRDADLLKMSRDRLSSALPKLRDSLALALSSERHERWLVEYEKVETGHGPLQQDIDDFHARFADEADALEDKIAQFNAEVKRVNELAFQLDERRRLPRLSLWAVPASPRRRWGPPKVEGSFAAAYAQSMIVPYHPGAGWADPEVQEKRRAEIEQEQRRMAQYHERAAKAEEERANREERERFTALQDRKSG